MEYANACEQPEDAVEGRCVGFRLCGQFLNRYWVGIDMVGHLEASDGAETGGDHLSKDQLEELSLGREPKRITGKDRGEERRWSESGDE